MTGLRERDTDHNIRREGREDGQMVAACGSSAESDNGEGGIRGWGERGRCNIARRTESKLDCWPASTKNPLEVNGQKLKTATIVLCFTLPSSSWVYIRKKRAENWILPRRWFCQESGIKRWVKEFMLQGVKARG